MARSAGGVGMKDRETPGDAQDCSTPALEGSSSGTPADTSAAAHVSLPRPVFTGLEDWQWQNNDPKTETLVSPCGRYEIIRIRITVLSRRYSAWDKYPTDGDGLPALKGVSHTAKGALSTIR